MRRDMARRPRESMGAVVIAYALILLGFVSVLILGQSGLIISLLGLLLLASIPVKKIVDAYDD